MTATATLLDRDIVRVEGPDAFTYLQGQLSQDLDALAVATSTWTFVLGPQGKVDSWARVTKTAADAFLLDVDAGAGAALDARLRRFLIRTKADVESGTWPAVAVRGEDAPRPAVPDDVLRLPVVGPGVAGYDLLGPGAEVPGGVTLRSIEDFHADRIVHGVPAAGSELTDATIPAEIGDWIIEAAVSFSKGCYVGQELTARIDSRGGNVPRRLRVLTLARPVPVGAPVVAADGSGVVTSVGVSDRHGPVALAFCGRGVEVGDPVTVDGVDGVVHAPPLA